VVVAVNAARAATATLRDLTGTTDKSQYHVAT
jgi:hypothetical protein